MNKFFRKIKNIFYALPFGLKGADTEIMGSSNSIADGVTVNQQIKDNTVAQHLLKGEVTQAVEELRYRTYKVERESNNYDYVGGGIAVKKDKPTTDNKKKKIIKFTQENKLICNDVLTELNRVNGYATENYTVTLGYNSVIRIKLEKFLTAVDVLINQDENKATTTFHFSSMANPSEFASKPFVASLNALYEAFKKKDKRAIEKSDFNTVICMNFVTSNLSEGEVNVVNYSFLTPTLTNIDAKNGEYLISYEWEKYVRVDLTDRFYSKEMDEKYKTKARKDYAPVIGGELDGRKYQCSRCGKEVSVFDGDIMMTDLGEVLCPTCYIKSLLEKEKE